VVPVERGREKRKGYVISTGNPRSLPGTEFFGVYAHRCSAYVCVGVVSNEGSVRRMDRYSSITKDSFENVL